jgi:hypothetical protein
MVFVSSTFEDLEAERNALQRYVFTRLAEYCATKKARFQAIDLRWGVSREASLDQRAMDVCLTEIERCQSQKLKPNFIVLLGDRYGWRPLPARVGSEEFVQIFSVVPEEDAGLLLWAEGQPADAKGWYRRDDNAVPAAYVFRPREVTVPEGASTEERKAASEAEYEAWKKTEPKLWAILLRAVESLGWSAEDPLRATYVDSATAQEIVHGALRPADAAQHVFAFFRSETGGAWQSIHCGRNRREPREGRAHRTHRGCTQRQTWREDWQCAHRR